jgi:hypothetical protein
MQTLRRVGIDTAHLTDEELMYVDSRIVETVRPLLIGRRLWQRILNLAVNRISKSKLYWSCEVFTQPHKQLEKLFGTF